MELVAQTYANALFSLALEEGNDNEILTQLEDLYLILEKDDSLIKLMINRNISKNEKREIIIDLFKDRTNKMLLNFLKLLVDKSRINYLKEICEEYQKQYYSHYKIKVANVYSAVELSEEKTNEVQKSLEEKYNNKFIIKSFVDESLIAGLKIVIGDLVIDGSVSNKLNRMKENIIASTQK